jgi:hypothetical protein
MSHNIYKSLGTDQLFFFTITIFIKLLDPEPDLNPVPDPNQEEIFRIRIRQKKLGSSRIRIRNTDWDST